MQDTDIKEALDKLAEAAKIQPTFVVLNVVKREPGMLLGSKPRTYRHLCHVNQIEGITPESDGTCTVILQSKHKGFAEIEVLATEEQMVKMLNARVLE